MPTLLISSKGQIVLPAALRRKLAWGPGSRLEALEEPDGLKLRIVNAAPVSDVSRLAGMVRARRRGEPRSLDDFDAASVLATKRSARRP